MTHRRSSSFFKILLDASAPHLPLPPDFISKHLGNKIPKDPIIRSATGGHSWRVKIKKIGESFCFSSGWDIVVTDIKLEFGDFLVFLFDDKSTFKMMVYSPNGCEKDIPPKIDYNSSSTSDDDVVKDKEVEIEVEEDEIEVEEDEIEVEEDEIEAEDDEIEAEDDDDDDEEEEDEEYDEEYVEEKDDGDDDEDDGDIDGDDGDPFFTTTMSETHKNVLRLPPEFVRLAGIDGEGPLTMRNDEGKEWETRLRLDKWNQSERYCVSAGWDGFRRSNDLCEGDECFFKFIRSEDTLLLVKVTKKKRPARKSLPSVEAPVAEVTKRGQPEGNSGKVPATKIEVVKRKRGRPGGNAGEVPATEVVKRKRGQRQGNSGEVPATKIETRRGSRAVRGRGASVRREEERVEVVKRPRGRPFKRRRGKPARRK